MLSFVRGVLGIAVLVSLIWADEERFVVGFAQDTMANDWRAAQVRHLKEALADEPGIEFITKDGEGSLALSMQNVDDLIRMGVDVLVSSPVDAAGMRPVLSAAYDQGIAVVLLTREVSGDKYTTFIRPDDRIIAADAANFIAKSLEGQGRVLVLQGLPTASTAIARSEGFLDALGGHQGVTLAGIEVANYLRADAIRAVELVLASGTPFDAIYAQSDSMAIGAIMALEAAGIDPASKIIVGIDYIQEARALIKAGKMSATYLYPTASKEGAEAIKMIRAGDEVPKEWVLKTVRITEENIDEVEPIF